MRFMTHHNNLHNSSDFPEPGTPESLNRELTQEAFKTVGLTNKASVTTLSEARRMGVFTCADALALGLDYMVKRSSRLAFSEKNGKPAFMAAVQQLCGQEISEH